MTQRMNYGYPQYGQGMNPMMMGNPYQPYMQNYGFQQPMGMPYYPMNNFYNPYGGNMMGYQGMYGNPYNQFQGYRQDIMKIEEKKNEDAIDFNEDVCTAQQNNLLAMQAINMINDNNESK